MSGAVCAMLIVKARDDGFMVWGEKTMYVLQVFCRVKAEFVNEFMEASRDNARNSVLEPGVVRFDFHQQLDDPTKFTIIEVYRDANAPAKHRETAHYLRWRDIVGDMLAEARTRVEYRNVFPEDDNWK
jgi:quinol monooxygenase YgiN